MARIELIDEIATAGQRIGEARTSGGELVFPTDAQTRLLRAVERSPHCLAIADAARVLRVSRQAAHRVAHRAAAAGGLGGHAMATATHVVRVIRQRLERDARELAQRRRR